MYAGDENLPADDDAFGPFSDEPESVYCQTHGWTTTTGGGSTAGFTGAAIYWEDRACGCQWMDDSADTLERVR